MGMVLNMVLKGPPVEIQFHKSSLYLLSQASPSNSVLKSNNRLQGVEVFIISSVWIRVGFQMECVLIQPMPLQNQDSLSSVFQK